MTHAELLSLAKRLRASLIAAKREAEDWYDDSRGKDFTEAVEWWAEANAVLKDSEAL